MTDLVQKLVRALEALHAATAGQHNFAHALELTRAALSEAKAGGWQPIETAPKGETFLAVLACGGEQTICTMRHSVAEAKNSRPHGDFERERVTHWQPLPAPPAQRGEG